MLFGITICIKTVKIDSLMLFIRVIHSPYKASWSFALVVRIASTCMHDEFMC